MPHVIVKMWPGQTAEDMERLADLIVKDVVAVVGCREEVVTVAIEEVPKDEWAEKVFRPEIVGKAETLIRKPGYTM